MLGLCIACVSLSCVNEHRSVQFPESLRVLLVQLDQLSEDRPAIPASERKERFREQELVIASEVNRHRKEIFYHQLAALRELRVDNGLVDRLALLRPEAKWPIDDDLVGEGGLGELYAMMPITMTVFATAYLDEQTRTRLAANNDAVGILGLNDNACTTYILSAEYAFLVDFRRSGFRWEPTEAKLFVLRELSRGAITKKQKALQQAHEAMSTQGDKGVRYKIRFDTD